MGRVAEHAAGVHDTIAREGDAKGLGVPSHLQAGASYSQETGAAAAPGTSRAAAASTLALAVAACGGGGGSGSPPPPGTGTPAPSPTPTVAVVKPASDAQAARFLLRAGFATAPAQIAELRSRGYEPWLDAEMSKQNAQTAAQFFAARGYDKVDSNRWYNRSDIADNMIWSQLMNGGSDLRKRVALALSEFFVVSTNGVNTAWRSQAMGEFWDVLNRNAFGNYRNLLEDVTLNPAMGLFLNTRGNRKADAASGRVPDENYGREVMQLFSIGLFELNPDGSERLSGGQPIETYDNDDVTGIAKAFTGYDYDYAGLADTVRPATDPGRTIPHVDYVRRPMTADPSRWRRPRSTGYHSDAEKSFLGTTIPAGTGAQETLARTLDTLFAHPNVPPFFSRQMIQRLVTSNPSPGYVRRVADVFADNGSGVRGDLRAVFKAILLDPEARDPATLTDARFGKLREPMVRLAQFARTFGARSESGNWEIGDLSDPASRLGQSPLRSPSVFNFFRPTYTPANSQAAANDMVSPEFQIVNETSVAGYINFVERFVEGRGYWARDVKAAFSAELDLAEDAAALLDRLDLLLTGGQLNPATRNTILAAMEAQPVTAASDEAARLRRVHTGVLLTLVSIDYLVQK